MFERLLYDKDEKESAPDFANGFRAVFSLFPCSFLRSTQIQNQIIPLI